MLLKKSKGIIWKFLPSSLDISPMMPAVGVQQGTSVSLT
jgi:hypothetical protein